VTLNKSKKGKQKAILRLQSIQEITPKNPLEKTGSGEEKVSRVQEKEIGIIRKRVSLYIQI